MIELMLSLPEVYTLAVGSRSCMQFMYLATYGKPQAERLLYVPQELRECIDSAHLETVETAVDMALKAGAKAVLLYLCCSDVLIGTDFAALCTRLEQKHGAPIRALPRGFVATRRQSSTACLLDIVDILFARMSGVKSKNTKQVALLSARPVSPDSVLFSLLHNAGWHTVSNHCETLAEFASIPNSQMALALDSFGAEFAKSLHEHGNLQYLAIPFRFDERETESDLQQLCSVLRLLLDCDAQRREMQAVCRAALCRAGGKSIAVGIQGQAVALAASLLSMGFCVQAIFCDELSKKDAELLRKIATAHPDVRIYFNSVLNALDNGEALRKIEIAIGSKAGFFCPDAEVISYHDSYGFAYEKLCSILEAIV
jgi:nitrogenase molybdenum-iron protein alpha/beta subunit